MRMGIILKTLSNVFLVHCRVSKRKVASFDFFSFFFFLQSYQFCSLFPLSQWMFSRHAITQTVLLLLDVWVTLVFWRTLMPSNGYVWLLLLDWYYLVLWLWRPDGSTETVLFWSTARGAGLSVGFLCWLSRRPCAWAECVFVCPELSVKDRLSRTRSVRLILGVFDWSPWCSSWEDTMCVFPYEKERWDRFGRFRDLDLKRIVF